MLETRFSYAERLLFIDTIGYCLFVRRKKLVFSYKLKGTEISNDTLLYLAEHYIPGTIFRNSILNGDIVTTQNYLGVMRAVLTSSVAEVISSCRLKLAETVRLYNLLYFVVHSRSIRLMGDC